MAEKTHMYLLAIVSIVAVVGIVVLLLHASSTVSLSTDITGEAFSAVKTSNTLTSSKASVAAKGSTEETRIPGVKKTTCESIRNINGEGCTEIVVCPETTLVPAASGVQYSCEVDCHGQKYAGSDGKCDCDIIPETCERA